MTPKPSCSKSLRGTHDANTFVSAVTSGIRTISLWVWHWREGIALFCLAHYRREATPLSWLTATFRTLWSLFQCSSSTGKKATMSCTAYGSTPVPDPGCSTASQSSQRAVRFKAVVVCPITCPESPGGHRINEHVRFRAAQVTDESPAEVVLQRPFEWTVADQIVTNRIARRRRYSAQYVHPRPPSPDRQAIHLVALLCLANDSNNPTCWNPSPGETSLWSE